jgi:hypothetical protein
VIVNVVVGGTVVKVRADPSVRPKRDERVYLKANPNRVHLFGDDGRRLNA